MVDEVAKPREFWLWYVWKMGVTVHNEDPNIDLVKPLEKVIHVIEKSAYDKLKKHAEKLAEALQDAAFEFNCPDPNHCDASIALANYRKAYPKEGK